MREEGRFDPYNCHDRCRKRYLNVRMKRYRGEGLDGEEMVLDLNRFRYGLVEVVVNSCRLLTQNEFFLLLVYGESYFLQHLTCGGLCQWQGTNECWHFWPLNTAKRMMWEKGGRDDSDWNQPNVSINAATETETTRITPLSTAMNNRMLHRSQDTHHGNATLDQIVRTIGLWSTQLQKPVEPYSISDKQAICARERPDINNRDSLCLVLQSDERQ